LEILFWESMLNPFDGALVLSGSSIGWRYQEEVVELCVNYEEAAVTISLEFPQNSRGFTLGTCEIDPHPLRHFLREDDCHLCKV